MLNIKLSVLITLYCSLLIIDLSAKGEDEFIRLQSTRDTSSEEKRSEYLKKLHKLLEKYIANKKVFDIEAVKNEIDITKETTYKKDSPIFKYSRLWSWSLKQMDSNYLYLHPDGSAYCNKWVTSGSWSIDAHGFKVTHKKLNLHVIIPADIHNPNSIIAIATDSNGSKFLLNSLKMKK